MTSSPFELLLSVNLQLMNASWLAKRFNTCGERNCEFDIVFHLNVEINQSTLASANRGLVKWQNLLIYTVKLVASITVEVPLMELGIKLTVTAGSKNLRF